MNTGFVWLPKDDNYSWWLWCLFSILYSNPQALLTHISDETTSLSKYQPLGIYCRLVLTADIRRTGAHDENISYKAD